jgi:hypothetical protein
MSTNQELEELITSIVSTIINGGTVTVEENVQEEEEVQVPEFLVTVNGQVVTEPVADEDELKEVILAVSEANPDADVQIYVNIDVQEIF